MHNNNRHRVNLFSDVVATLRRACRGRNSLCTWKSLRYTSRRVVSTQKTALLAVAAAHPSDIPSGNAAVICGTGKRNNIKESSAIKESRFVLRFYVVDSLVVATMRGEILKSIVSTTTRRVAPRRAATCAIRYTRDKEIAPTTARLATVGRCYCLLITTAVLWKHRDRSHCRV